MSTTGNDSSDGPMSKPGTYLRPTLSAVRNSLSESHRDLVVFRTIAEQMLIESRLSDFDADTRVETLKERYQGLFSIESSTQPWRERVKEFARFVGKNLCAGTNDPWLEASLHGVKKGLKRLSVDPSEGINSAAFKETEQCLLDLAYDMISVYGLKPATRQASAIYLGPRKTGHERETRTHLLGFAFSLQLLSNLVPVCPLFFGHGTNAEMLHSVLRRTALSDHSLEDEAWRKPFNDFISTFQNTCDTPPEAWADQTPSHLEEVRDDLGNIKRILLAIGHSQGRTDTQPMSAIEEMGLCLMLNMATSTQYPLGNPRTVSDSSESSC